MASFDAAVTLQPIAEDRKVLLYKSQVLVLTNCASEGGLRLVTIGPPPEVALDFVMQVSSVQPAGRDGSVKRTIRAEGRVPWRDCWTTPDQPQAQLLVPNSFWSSSGSIEVSITLEEAASVPAA